MAVFFTYTDSIRRFAAERPDHPALIFDSQAGRTTVTSAAFDGWADRVAELLAHAGVTRNSAVIIAAPNCSEAVVAAAAAWRLGAFVVPISDRSSPADRASAVSISRLVKPHVLLIDAAAELGDADGAIALDVLASAPAGRPARDVEPDPSRAIPSGGTTGRPKLIVSGERWGLDPDAVDMLDPIGWRTARSVLVYSPLYHNVGLNLTHMALMAGKTTVLMDQFDASRVAAILAADAIEFFFAVPTHMQRIMQVPGIEEGAFRSVKTMYHSGASCPVSVKREWLALLGPERVWEVYGATEGTGVTMVRGDEWLGRPGTVGRPFDCEIRVLDEQGGKLPAGEVGLIYMRPLGVAASAPYYLGAPPPARTDDGFSTVGDMGWLNGDGYLFVSDRRTDMIISGGVNVFPAEVEAALVRHRGVAAAAVVGLPDAQWGKRVHAVLVPTDGRTIDLHDLDEFLKLELLPYKRPKTYEVRSSLPYTDVGKIDRKMIIASHDQEPLTVGAAVSEMRS